MKKKRIILIAVFVTMFLTYASLGAETTEPVFDKPHSRVLDLKVYGDNYRDYVKITNSTSHEKCSFNVFAYDTKTDKWVLIGPADLQKREETATVRSVFNGKLRRFRWFAITSLDGFDFQVQVDVRRHDIRLTVF